MKAVRKGIIDYLINFKNARPNQLLYFSETEKYTTAEFYQKVIDVAAYLTDKGVEKGDFVGLAGTRSIKGVAFYLAIQYIGAVAVFCDPHSDIKTFIKELGIEIHFKLVLDIDIKDENFTVYGEKIDFENLKKCEDFYSGVDVFAPAIIVFTSGSTGINKGVVISQYNYVNHQRNFKHVGGYTKKDIAIQMLPIFHIFGITQINDSIINRCPIFFPKVVSPEDILESIEKYQITRFGFVPSFAVMMAKAKNKIGYNTESLCSMVLAGAPSTKEQFYFIENTLGANIVPVYGMTECPGISGAGPDCPPEKRATSVGMVLPMTKVKITKEGEITVKSPSLFIGYWGEEPIDRNKFFPTGDCGYIDEEGYLHVTGRKKDIIIRNGNNLSPLAIEKKLMALDFIEKASIVGIQVAEKDELPAAAIVLAEGKTFNERKVKETLNKLELPVKYIFLKELPLNSVGKIDKNKIREMF